ncbi:ABC transporter permease [Salmonella enterica]|uniref:ABC transporter permease n=1 Tax=Salmonella enterica TaxID=28901 RepID=UPI000E360A62|nr:ABC transporter permease [Salmonella enterica]AXR36596.1 macrolide ABC transporter permease/ATP-binding protein MacB [Salmonella enterica subsp. enterica]
MSSSIINLENVSFAYKNGEDYFNILNNFNLGISHGDFVAIVGRSGSGKSTIMNIMGCLEKPDQGIVCISDVNIYDPDFKDISSIRCKTIGFIFQRYHLLNHLTVYENISIPAVYAGMARSEIKKRVFELARKLDISDKLYLYPNQLSGGQQQRVCIARALINGADVILADEPTGALDSKNSADVLNILRELNNDGITIVIITHDDNIARRANRIIEVSDGKITKDKTLNVCKNKSGISGNKNFSQDMSGVSLYKIYNVLLFAIRAITSQTLRTFLTILGIVIGISSVIISSAIGEGIKKEVLNELSKLGKSVVEIRGRDDNGGGYYSQQKIPLKSSDISNLFKMPWVNVVTPIVTDHSLISYHNKQTLVVFSGIESNYFFMKGILLKKGRFFYDKDSDNRNAVIIIDTTTENSLFGKTDTAIGKIVYLSGVPFKVIGVADTPGPKAEGGGLTAWIPYKTYDARINRISNPERIYINFKNNIPFHKALSLTEDKLTELHGSKDFEIWSDRTLEETIAKTSDSLSSLITAIASISLLVGSIGLMNVMLSSVKERVYEIGIRRAIGAKKSDILIQYIMESILICFIGGLVGISIALLVSIIMSALFNNINMEISLSILLLACSCSVVIGACAGIYPALKASRIQPAEALVKG